jgi:hypothetical protein
MTIFKRAQEIIVNPKVTWQIIKDEVIDNRDLLVNYAAALSLIPAVCALIGMTIVGIRLTDGMVVRAPFFEALLGGVVGYFLNLGAVFAAAWLMARLAPFFNARAELNAALKVAVYSLTPVWLAGVFSILPGLGILSLLGLYGIYLLVNGLTTVMETPADKILWYTLSILILGFFLSLVVSFLTIGLFYGPMFMRMMAV